MLEHKRVQKSHLFGKLRDVRKRALGKGKDSHSKQSAPETALAVLKQQSDLDNITVVSSSSPSVGDLLSTMQCRIQTHLQENDKVFQCNSENYFGHLLQWASDVYTMYRHKRQRIKKFSDVEDDYFFADWSMDFDEEEEDIHDPLSVVFDDDDLHSPHHKRRRKSLHTVPFPEDDEEFGSVPAKHPLNRTTGNACTKGRMKPGPGTGIARRTKYDPSPPPVSHILVPPRRLL